jgi:hypothetical protein
MYERSAHLSSVALPVTIASVRAHGVRQLLVYCLGKREGDWPAIIKARCLLIASRPKKFCKTSSAAAGARSVDGGELICDLTTASSRLRGRVSAG